MFAIVRLLDKALDNHDDWLKTLHQSLICSEPHANKEDMQDDAHHHCKFGQWFYNEAPDEISSTGLYEKIGELHLEMHNHARELLRKKQANEVIETTLYEKFINEALVFKLEVRNLQFDLLNQVCAVDELTGAWNRHTMYYKLVQEQERAIRKGHDLHICMLDIDHFKPINDNHGHLAGDVVLKEFTIFCTDSLRKYDSFFRYGGEEFLCCMPDLSMEEAKSAVDRLREDLSDLKIRLPSGEEIGVTASFGLVQVGLDKGIEESIQNADHALLNAKADGRNRVCVWGCD
jgi:diguanylate cyclase (GGDEF)-like protein